MPPHAPSGLVTCGVRLILIGYVNKILVARLWRLLLSGMLGVNFGSVVAAGGTKKRSDLNSCSLDIREPFEMGNCHPGQDSERILQTWQTG